MLLDENEIKNKTLMLVNGQNGKIDTKRDRKLPVARNAILKSKDLLVQTPEERKTKTYNM